MVFWCSSRETVWRVCGGGVMYNTLETVVFPLPVEAPDEPLVSCRVNTNLAPLFRSYQQISPDPKEGSCRNS